MLAVGLSADEARLMPAHDYRARSIHLALLDRHTTLSQRLRHSLDEMQERAALMSLRPTRPPQL